MRLLRVTPKPSCKRESGARHHLHDCVWANGYRLKARISGIVDFLNFVIGCLIVNETGSADVAASKSRGACCYARNCACDAERTISTVI
jgi:hypothetical protein